jgi:hypothetical protein
VNDTETPYTIFYLDTQCEFCTPDNCLRDPTYAFCHCAEGCSALTTWLGGSLGEFGVTADIHGTCVVLGRPPRHHSPRRCRAHQKRRAHSCSLLQAPSPAPFS